MGAVVWSLPVVVGLLLPVWEHGPPPEAAASLVIAGLLLRAREAHATRPGLWFPLLVTGSSAFAVSLALGRTDFGPTGRFLVGLAVAIGLGGWAWRARSGTVAVTALAYLTAVWYLVPRDAEPATYLRWSERYYALSVSYEHQPYPELLIVAAAVSSHARLRGFRPWHVAAIAGLIGMMLHQGAVVLLLAAVVLAAYHLNAHRPGVWYPLALVGVGLVAWPIVEPWTAPTFEDLPNGSYQTIVAIPMSAAATSYSSVDYDDLFLAALVALGLTIWAWRRRSVVVLPAGVAYLAATWLVSVPRDPSSFLVVDLAWSAGGPKPHEFVVAAGAAVALATRTRERL